ncbi:hypothetical protein BEE12_16180 [Pantoea agglomerans]|nr:hypothetical protein BEE12_16180 [Pantoea agglomerans]
MPMSFAWNQEAAEAAKTAGTGTGISETGAYEGVITSAVYQFGKEGSQSQALEISLDCNGQKANYLRINYMGKDGKPTFGFGLISAILWATQVKQALPVQESTPEGVIWKCPALEGKRVGLFLQKGLYTKQDGSDGYRFEVRHVFQPGTRRTYSEHSANEPAKIIDTLCETVKDKDDRQPVAGGQRGGWGQPTQPTHSGWGAPNPDTVAPQSRLNQAAQTQQPQQAQEWDDDIPF